MERQVPVLFTAMTSWLTAPRQLSEIRKVYPRSTSRHSGALILHAADIVKMIDSQPDLANHIRRVRGGYLKIQGTWMPYEVGCFMANHIYDTNAVESR